MSKKIAQVLCISGIFCFFTLVLALTYDANREWKTYQKEFYRLEAAKAPDAEKKQDILNTPLAIKQTVVNALGRVDRCETCHLGVERPKNKEEKEPFRYHKNHNQHSFQKFGCTVCHEGQGLATTTKAAHGPITFWEQPLLPLDYIEASCGKCHKPEDLPEAPKLIKARELFLHSGCLGCHKVGGKGGVVGPEITKVATKDSHGYDFKNIEGEHTPRQWLLEHFKSPERVTPGSLMQNIRFNDEDAYLLTLYMLSLHGQDTPSDYIPPVLFDRVESPLSGQRLYTIYCSACHGKTGRGSTARLSPYEEAQDVPLELMVPTLSNPDTQDELSDSFLRHTIIYGRSGSSMNPWGTIAGGGLTSDEIDRLVDFMRTWELPGADLDALLVDRGETRAGSIFYERYCTACHGHRGEGDIGPSLNSEGFLAVASDTFLAKTIITGRANTAMPAWKQFTVQQINDLIKLLRTWQRNLSSRKASLRLLTSGYAPAVSVTIGKTLFNANCIACHGERGEGDLGPSLATQEFLTIADNTYLYETIASGRPGTAMPAWRHFSNQDVASLVKYIRTWQKERSRVVSANFISGEWRIGRNHFQDLCASCHGTSAEGGTGIQLSNQVFLRLANDGMLREWIAFGKIGTPMRGFGKGSHGIVELNERQITDIIAYLRHLQKYPLHIIKKSPDGRPNLGRVLYANVCASCHGTFGEGASGPSLSNESFLETASDGFLMATLVLGRDGTEMRPLVRGAQSIQELSSEQINDTVAYVRTWERLAPVRELLHRVPEPTDTFNGKLLYESHCSGCHGIKGKTEEVLSYEATRGLVVAPELNNKQFLTAATDGFLTATIIRGRQGTAMRAFGQGMQGMVDLKTQEIEEIVAYIRQWYIQPSPIIVDTEVTYRDKGT